MTSFDSTARLSKNPKVRIKSNADKVWETIIEKYFQLNLDYIEDHNGQDAVFGYTEMANVSMLATACWMLKWPAIVEYQQEKYTGSKINKNKKKKYKLGRVDLYFARGSTEYICEAKQHSSNGDNIFSDSLRKKMLKAHDDALRSSKNGKDDYLPAYGLVFVPHLVTNKCAEDAESLQTTISRIEKALDNACGEKKTHSQQRKKAEYIDGYGSMFLNSPVPEWTFSGNKQLIGVSILIRRARQE